MSNNDIQWHACRQQHHFISHISVDYVTLNFKQMPDNVKTMLKLLALTL